MPIDMRILCGVLMASALLGQSSATAFEVASVKLYVSPPGKRAFTFYGANPIKISGNRIAIRLARVAGLVAAAYGVKDFQVSGGPGWASSAQWDINAKAPGDGEVTMEQARVMLQTLLADRFHVELRHETKEIPVYTLVVAKGGLKMKPAPPGTPRDPQAQRMTIDQIMGLAAGGLDRPLIDQTGLSGEFDAKWDLTSMVREAAAAPEGVSKSAVTLTSIEESLGLKAEAAKTMADTLVIESAEIPEEN